MTHGSAGRGGKLATVVGRDGRCANGHAFKLKTHRSERRVMLIRAAGLDGGRRVLCGRVGQVVCIEAHACPRLEKPVPAAQLFDGVVGKRAFVAPVGALGAVGVDPGAQRVAAVRVVRVEEVERGGGHGGDGRHLTNLNETVLKLGAVGGLSAEAAQFTHLLGREQVGLGGSAHGVDGERLCDGSEYR